MALNVTALVELTHAYMADIESTRGGVIQVASTAAFQPVPYSAVYGATKAFVLFVLGGAVGRVSRPRRARAGALPGRDRDVVSSTWRAKGLGAGARGCAPVAVVRTGLRAFDANRSFVVHGIGNYLLASSARFTPRAWTARVAERLMRPRPVLPPATALQPDER